MDWNKFAKEVYQTAVENGLWDKPVSFDDIICECLVHLGRAYEDHLSGRPNYYHLCKVHCDKNHICDHDLGKPCPLSNIGPSCKDRDPKPEGVAVAFADCVLRLLDYMGKENVALGETSIEGLECEALVSFSAFIVRLFTILVASCGCVGEVRYTYLAAEILCALVWARQNNNDLEPILRELHECDKARAGRRKGTEP